MIKAISDLIKVKTLVTLAATGGFIYLSSVGKIEPQQYITIFSMIISFYFGVQHEKKGKENTTETEKTE